MRYSCQTLFDITATGVTGHYKPATRMNSDEWNQARNQQRNWETLTQILNLRTQIMSITSPTYKDNKWVFEFESESNVWDDGTDPVGVLKTDSAGVPMLRELNNDPDIDPILIVGGPRQNIWFELVPINNILEN